MNFVSASTLLSICTVPPLVLWARGRPGVGGVRGIRQHVSLVAREYGVSSSLLFRWRQHRDAGSLTGLKAGEPVVPESEMQKLKAQVRELQRLLGKKTEEVEILRAGIEIAREKKTTLARGVGEAGRFAVKAIARAFGVARSNLMAPRQPREKRQPDAAEDNAILGALTEIASRRSTYGYRRTTAVLNRLRKREGRPLINHKRTYRLMRANGLLLQRHTDKPTRTHEGKVVTLKSDLRYCSDTFEIRCWNGERVQVAFSLDCCDREAIAYRASVDYPTAITIRDLIAETVEKRFGAGVNSVPILWSGSPTTGPSTPLTRRGTSVGDSDWSSALPRPIPLRATGWPRPSSKLSSAITST